MTRPAQSSRCKDCAPSAASGITFSFNAAVLGQLPTHVGLVWTDAGGGATITFRVFGPGGLLGSLVGFSAPDSHRQARLLATLRATYTNGNAAK